MDGTGEESTLGRADRYSGPLTVTAAIVGKKWHPRIVAALLESGPLGFSELKTRLEGISDKVLSESLDDLEERGLVDRAVIDDKPVRVEYSLTEWGERLRPVVAAMTEWGERYVESRCRTRAGK